MKRSLMLKQILALTMFASVIGGCGGGGRANPPPERHDITAAQLQAMMADGQPLIMLDVRTQTEYDGGHIPGAILAPLADLPNWVGNYHVGDRIVAVCRSGNRSGQAADQLVARGFTDIYNLLGGMNGWTGAVVQ